MTEASLNLSGLWMGSFSYPAGQGPTTLFLARIEDDGGAISGTTIEPNTVGVTTRELEAVIRGSRTGRSLDFTKTYDGASDAAHAVDYVGQVSQDGNRIAGVWSLEVIDGTFEMSREAVWEEAKGEEVEVVEVK